MSDNTTAAPTEREPVLCPLCGGQAHPFMVWDWAHGCVAAHREYGCCDACAFAPVEGPKAATG